MILYLMCWLVVSLFIVNHFNFKQCMSLLQLSFMKYLQHQILQEMHSSWLQEVRLNLQAIQILQKSIISEMLAIQDNPKDNCIGQHRINNFSGMIQERVNYVLTFIKEENQLKKQQLAIIEGQKSLKNSQKKKPNDVIWQNFYDKAKQIKDMYKKQESSLVIQKNTVQYYRNNVFKAPLKQPDFSIQENKGKYVDMHTIYVDYLNLCKIMEENKQITRLHDYLWFLQHMDKFDDFPINKKFKHHPKYVIYLNKLYEYLIGFYRRSRPLSNYQHFQINIHSDFQQKYSQGKHRLWDHHSEQIDESNLQYCHFCKKLFINNEAFVGHLIGKKHIKLQQQEVQHDPQEEARVKQQYIAQIQKKKKNLAFLQFRVTKIREQLAGIIYDTMNLVRKKQARGYEQIQEQQQFSSEQEEADAPIYNPKNLPLGWDGKPIPYWLYKLHGLGIQYKCQICGNYSYWGRRAFQMHFQEWRHTYGMKCLKIPNTIHFKDITTINDALALHQKLMRESQENQFRADLQEQFEDNEGNLLNKRTYLDMKKQGLIQ